MSLIRALLNFFFPRGKLDYREPAWGVIALFTYLGTALFTFGHVAGRHPYHDFTHVPCREIEGRDGKKYPARKDSLCPVEVKNTIAAMTFFKGIGSGVVWPFYWSWHLQEENPHG